MMTEQLEVSIDICHEIPGKLKLINKFRIHNFRFRDFRFCKVEDSKVNAENTQDTDPKGTNLTKYLISAGKL